MGDPSSHRSCTTTINPTIRSAVDAGGGGGGGGGWGGPPTHQHQHHPHPHHHPRTRTPGIHPLTCIVKSGSCSRMATSCCFFACLACLAFTSSWLHSGQGRGGRTWRSCVTCAAPRHVWASPRRLIPSPPLPLPAPVQDFDCLGIAQRHGLINGVPAPLVLHVGRHPRPQQRCDGLVLPAEHRDVQSLRAFAPGTPIGWQGLSHRCSGGC